MKNLTFEEVPQAVSAMQHQINEIHNLLLKSDLSQKTPQDELLTVQDAAKFLRLSVPTIYGLTSKGELPVMKRSKRCYFTKSDLLNYLKSGRKLSNSEIGISANKHISKSI